MEAVNPTKAKVRAEYRSNKCLSKKPCTSTDISPTANSAQPFCAGPQPNLKLV